MKFTLCDLVRLKLKFTLNFITTLIIQLPLCPPFQLSSLPTPYSLSSSSTLTPTSTISPPQHHKFSIFLIAIHKLPTISPNQTKPICSFRLWIRQLKEAMAHGQAGTFNSHLTHGGEKMMVATSTNTKKRERWWVFEERRENGGEGSDNDEGGRKMRGTGGNSTTLPTCSKIRANSNRRLHFGTKVV